MIGKQGDRYTNDVDLIILHCIHTSLYHDVSHKHIWLWFANKNNINKNASKRWKNRKKIIKNKLWVADKKFL